MISVEFVPGILAGLIQRHSKLEIEISVSDNYEDILRRQADIALRMYRPKQVGLLAKRVGTVELGFYASRECLARVATPTDLAQLAGLVLIGEDRGTAIDDSLARLGGLQVDLPFAIRTDSSGAQLAMIAAGAGIGVCPSRVAERRGFIRVLPAVIPPLEAWVAMHEDLRDILRYRVVFDALASVFA